MAGVSWNDVSYEFFLSGGVGVGMDYETPCLTIATDTDNQIVLCGSATDDPTTFTASGLDTNIPVTFASKGTGHIVFNATDILDLGGGALIPSTGLDLGSGSDPWGDAFLGTVTVVTRTGTAAKFACFDSGGKLVEKATACA